MWSFYFLIKVFGLLHIFGWLCVPNALIEFLPDFLYTNIRIIIY